MTCHHSSVFFHRHGVYQSEALGFLIDFCFVNNYQALFRAIVNTTIEVLKMCAESDRDKENDLPSNALPIDDEIVRAKKEKWARYI